MTGVVEGASKNVIPQLSRSPAAQGSRSERLEAFDAVFVLGYIAYVEWDIEFTDEFGSWWDGLDEREQDSVRDIVALLRVKGPLLSRPFADSLYGARYNLKELRIQHEGRPYRVLFAFDPRRIALLLLGGDKTGNDRWYDEFIPKAEKIYEQHLHEIKKR